MKVKVYFKEDQTFVGTWMWYLVIVMMVFAMLGASIPLLLKGATESIVGMTIVALLSFGLLFLMHQSRLYVSIDPKGLYYRFPPFVSQERKLTLGDLSEIYVRKYRPLWEYGGWGYRYRFRAGRALSVNGNTGLQLVLKNGKRLLIGTQRPEAMKHAVKRLKENGGLNG